MQRSEVVARLSAILGQVVDDPSVSLCEDTVASDVEGWDSLAHVTFMVEVQRAFGIRVGSGDIEGMRRVGDVVGLVLARGE